VRARWAVVLALAFLRACAAPEQVADPAPPSAAAVTLEEVSGSAREDVPSALDRIDDPALPEPLVDPARVISGGPPPDGIPPIDEPTFEPAVEVDWLTDDEPVLAPAIGAPARAYPVRILIWHEIVNDTIDGRPVSITYCPLCNSALAFDRRLGDRVLTFGTSGSLYQSDLVMYDRQTESLFPQLEGRAIAGVLAGAELDRVPVQTITWAQFRDANPDGHVLSRDTGVNRDYGVNPNTGYDDPSSQPFLFDGEPDPRLPPKERVAALGGDTDPVAVPLPILVEAGVLEVEVAGRPVVVWSLDGLRSALDTRDITEGATIGATGAFDPVLDWAAVDLQPVPGRSLHRCADRIELERPRPCRRRPAGRGAARPGRARGHVLVRLGGVPPRYPDHRRFLTPGGTCRDPTPRGRPARPVRQLHAHPVPGSFAHRGADGGEHGDHGGQRGGGRRGARRRPPPGPRGAAGHDRARAQRDDWPALYERVRAADILVIGTPIWLGEKSSVCTRVIERLYGNSGELNGVGQSSFYGKVGGVIVTGNEDGIKHVAMNVLYSLQHLGYVIPPQADAGWIGEAGPGPSYLDEGSGGPQNDFTQRNVTFMTWNLMHLAALLRDAGGMPAHGNDRTAWAAGARFDHPNPEYR